MSRNDYIKVCRYVSSDPVRTFIFLHFAYAPSLRPSRCSSSSSLSFPSTSFTIFDVHGNGDFRPPSACDGCNSDGRWKGSCVSSLSRVAYLELCLEKMCWKLPWSPAADIEFQRFEFPRPCNEELN